MYSKAFCKVYNEFGWNYFPEAFGEQLMIYLERNQIQVKKSMDLACGPGVLCEVLKQHGIQSAGMDFSEGMIAIAKERDPDIPYEVADMITYLPEERFDLVTCTGDAMNHITDLDNVDRIFHNVYEYLNPGGYFIFDILDDNEVALGEPIDLVWDEKVTAQFMITQNDEGIINLKVTVFEDGLQVFEENITETVHDTSVICNLLRKNRFQVLRCDQRLLEDQVAKGMKWFVIAKKPEGGLHG
ncbi:MAG: class I SAM-dependent methyltransferase [Lachnospiraceae bacterium]|nr:class I SAM-dependent methyltransferase [Lachnospiraceae bacterium]